MKIISVIFLLSILVISAPAVFAAGTDCPTTGLVPCGTATCPCELCDFFVMAQKIVNFVLFTIVPPVAILLTVIAGVFFILGSGYDPSLIVKGKTALTSIAVGLLIIYGSWLMVNLFFTTIGLANTDFGRRIGQWFVFPCGSQQQASGTSAPNLVADVSGTGAIINSLPATEAEAYNQLYDLLDRGEIDQGSFKIKPISKKRMIYIYVREPSDENAILAQKWLTENGYGNIPEEKIVYFKAAD